MKESMNREQWKQNTTWLIKGANLIDGNGGMPIENSVLVIENGVFVYVGAYQQEIEQSMREKYHHKMMVMDAAGKTIVPGLVECHVHLGGAQGGGALDWVLEDDRLQALRSANQARAMLEHGFTTIRDISKNGLRLKKLINNRELQGPRIVACGPGLSRRGGHGDCLELPIDYTNAHHPWSVIADGEDEVRKAVRDLLKHGSDCIKLWVTGGGLWETERETDQHYTQRELEVAVEEAAYLGIGTCAHCESVDGAKAALKAGIRSIEHGEELDEECIELMKKNDAYMVPTLIVLFDWFEREGPAYRPILDQFPGETLAEKEINRIIANFQAVKKAGIKFTVGADSFCNSLTPYGEFSLRELYSLVRAGCSEMETIVAATKWGAELLGLSQSVGTIEVGKCADLLIMDQCPLADIKNFNRSNFACIMKDGVVELTNEQSK